jgi:hypothetical protein
MARPEGVVLPKFTPRLLFLIDGTGAALSTLFLLVLAACENIFGMPGEVLIFLWPLALTFSVYSWSCYFYNPKNTRLFLLLLATVNILYCTFTTFLVGQYFEKLTAIGILYFVGEVAIILSLAAMEIKTALRKTESKR